MADSFSIDSPRRVLSLSRKRTSAGRISDFDDKGSGFDLSGQHGPKPAEVYGFVGSITTVVATAIFFIWAYFPEQWLHYIGIFYYPSRYWALVVPTYLMIIVVLALVFYLGLNFMLTPPPTSFNVIFDEHSREPQTSGPVLRDEDQPIQPISDLGIDQINELMFGEVK